jgi:hypothetical protein
VLLKVVWLLLSFILVIIFVDSLIFSFTLNLMVVFGLQEDDAVAHFGTLIYCLDRLYKAVKKPAKATGEWSRSVHVFL